MRSGLRRSTPRSRVQAQVPHPIGGDTTAVTLRAKRCRRRGNNPKDRAVRQAKSLGRSGPSFWKRGDSTVPSSEGIKDHVLRQDLVHPPLVGSPNVHVFDETHLGLIALAPFDQLAQFIIIEPANRDRVELQIVQSPSSQPTQCPPEHAKTHPAPSAGETAPA